MKNRIEPVQEKSDQQKGKYLHGDVYNGTPIHNDSKAKERKLNNDMPKVEKITSQQIEEPARKQ